MHAITQEIAMDPSKSDQAYTLMFTPCCVLLSSCRVHELWALPRELRLTQLSRRRTLPTTCHSSLICKTSSHPVPLLCTRAFVRGISARARVAVKGRSICPTLEPAGRLLSTPATDLAASICGLITDAAAVAASAAARPEADSAAVQPEVDAAAAGSEAAAAAAVRTPTWELGRGSNDVAADDDAEVTSSWPTVETGLAADGDTATDTLAGDW